MTQKRLIILIQILGWILLGVLCLAVLSKKLPEMGFIEHSVERIEESKTTVMDFSAATLATSVAITLLPDDVATPLADTLAGMNKYFIFILAVLVVEKMILLEGGKIVLMWLVPVACLLQIAAIFVKKEWFKSISVKILIFSAFVIFLIPFSTFFAQHVGSDYLEYVDETLEETQDSADTVNEVMTETEGDESILDKISNAFNSAVSGTTGLVEHFKTVVKKSINSIAIMIVVNFVVPVLVLLVFKWLLGELFHIRFDFSKITKTKKQEEIEEKKDE